MFVLAIIIAIPEENDRFATMNRIAPGLEVLDYVLIWQENIL